jgi:hypothetical protein
MDGVNIASDDELEEDRVKPSSDAGVLRTEVVIDDSEWDDAEVIN